VASTSTTEVARRRWATHPWRSLGLNATGNAAPPSYAPDLAPLTLPPSHPRANTKDLTQLMLLGNPDQEELSIFHVIDADADGFITAEDLEAYLKKIGERGQGPLELKDMIRELDVERNGRVSQHEFVLYMRAMRQEEKEKKRRRNIKKEIDSKTRRAFLIAKLEGRISDSNPLNEEILPEKKKKATKPVEIGFD
jgi:hypothetical protein